MKRKLTLFFVIFLLSVSVVTAKFISITTEIGDPIVADGSGTSQLSIVNLGDEAAFESSYVLLMPEGFESEEVFIGRLNPNNPYESEFQVKEIGGGSPGQYPGVLRVSYADGNGYPFSAVTPFNIVYKNRTTSSVFGVLEATTLTGDRNRDMKISIRNPDPKPHLVTITLYLPKELDAPQAVKTFEIGPSEKRDVTFKISSFSALPGSSYVVLAAITYVEEGLSHSTFAKGVVSVEEERSIFSTRILGAVLIVLVLIFLFYQIGGLKWKR
jgi:hypothetical protein